MLSNIFINLLLRDCMLKTIIPLVTVLILLETIQTKAT